MTVAAIAQEAPLEVSPPAQQGTQQRAAPPETARGDEPGMFKSVGRWFQDSFDLFKSGIQGAGDKLGNLGGRAEGAAKDAAEVAKDAAKSATDAAKGAAKGAANVARGAAKNAADTVARLPGTRVFDARERCAVAPNGAPDCRAAANAICRREGFDSGTSLDIQSAQKCPARIWLSGRSPAPGECEVESFVTRAVCR
ncbi:MAG: hypothetical protein WD073_10350 [Xanthobacteraceae bacterium]